MFQKKAEAGSVRDTARASARTGAAARRREMRFIGIPPLKWMYPYCFSLLRKLCGENLIDIYVSSPVSDMMDTSKAVRS